MKQIRKRLTYANVMSSLAVFLVLGGGAALAAGLGKNTVGTKQLKKEAVNAAKIKAGAVNGSKVQDGSLTGSDLNLGTIGTVPSATKATTATSADSAKTAETAKTATTATTATTAGKLGRLTTVRADFEVKSGAGEKASETVTCPAGTQAIGGGGRNDAVSNEGRLISSRPSIGESTTPETGQGFDGWRVTLVNTGAGALNASVWVICAG